MTEKEQALKKKIKENQSMISKLQEENIELHKQLLEEKTGYKEGDMVVTDKGEKGILTYHRQWNTSWHWMKIKKDGTPSSAVTYLSGNFKKID